MNSVEIGEATGIEYELSFGTKEGLVEKLPERKSELDRFWIHLKKMLQKSGETRYCLVHLPGEDYGTLKQFSTNVCSFPEADENSSVRL